MYHNLPPMQLDRVCGYIELVGPMICSCIALLMSKMSYLQLENRCVPAPCISKWNFTQVM